MATKKEYLEFILEQLSGLTEITYRMMMGEYIIYYRGKIAAYVCDNRFLVKPVKSVRQMLPGATLEPPCKGAKEMKFTCLIQEYGAIGLENRVWQFAAVMTG